MGRQRMRYPATEMQTDCTYLLGHKRINRDTIRQRHLSHHAKAAQFGAKMPIFSNPKSFKSFDDGLMVIGQFSLAEAR